MSQELLVAVLGGLLPLIITSMVAWLGGRNQESRRARALESAKRRVDFISAYLGAQSLADGPQKIAQIKQEAAIELKRVKLALDEELEEIEAQAPESESFFSQFFLFYKMKSFWSGLLRLGFYLVLLLTLAWSTLVTGQQSVMLGTGEINLASFILGLLVYVVPPILAALFIRWLAIRLHRRSTRA